MLYEVITIEFRGTLKFKNSLKIKGKFEGKIISNGHLIIGRESLTSADIDASIVTVSVITSYSIHYTKLYENILF